MEKSKRVLEYGPIGGGKGEPLLEVDGQDVIVKEGVLVISCKESPYDQMPVKDYFAHVVYPFLKARREATALHSALPPAQQRNTVTPRPEFPPRPVGM